jgi:hypothetical protein
MQVQTEEYIMTTSLRGLRITGLVIAAIIIPLLICAGWLLLGIGSDDPIDQEIANIDLGDGYTVRMWREPPDLDDIYPSIYYEITKSDTIVIPTRYLMSETEDYTYSIRVASADGGKLVLIHDEQLWEEGVFILYDKAENRDGRLQYRWLVR